MLMCFQITKIIQIKMIFDRINRRWHQAAMVPVCEWSDCERRVPLLVVHLRLRCGAAPFPGPVSVCVQVVSKAGRNASVLLAMDIHRLQSVISSSEAKLD